MAVITYGALAAKLRANAAAVATSATAPVTTANITALAELLDILAQQKTLGFSALKYCSDTTKDQLNSAS